MSRSIGASPAAPRRAALGVRWVTRERGSRSRSAARLVTGVDPADAPAIGGPDPARREATVVIGIVIRVARVGAVEERCAEGEARTEMAEAAMETAAAEPAESTMESAAAESASTESWAGRGFGSRKRQRQKCRSSNCDDRAQHDTLPHRMRRASVDVALR